MCLDFMDDISKVNIVIIILNNSAATQRHIMIKRFKSKEKEKILKTATEKLYLTYREENDSNDSVFFIRKPWRETKK